MANLESSYNDLNDQEKKYFADWKFTGNRLQRRLKIGPHKPLFREITEQEARTLAETKDLDEDFDIIPLQVTDAAGKTIGMERWWIDYAERQGRGGYAHLVRKSPWAYRCIEIRSRSLAAIPWNICKGDDILEDTEYEKRLVEVNPEINWEDLIAATESDLLIYSNAYWQKIRTGDKVTALFRLNPSTIRVVAEERGIAGFVQKTAGGQEFARKDVVYFKTYDPESDLTGIPALTTVAPAIEIEVEANKHLLEFFENKAMPDYIMSLPTHNTNEIKRISAQWKREFSGKGNQHKTGWVGGGAKPHMVGYAPKDLALAEVRAEARRQICAGMGVPPALVAAWEAANYATIREQRQSLYTEVLFPEARYIAGVINAELSPEFGSLKFKWDFTKVDAMQESEDAKVKRGVWLVDGRIVKPEVIAIELGYKAEDVPEPLPTPDFGKPSDNNNNVGRASTPPPAADDRKTESALRKWRRKCVNRIKQEKMPACDFNSDYISPTLGKIVSAGLKTAQTLDDVHDIFNDVWEWPETAREPEVKVEVHPTEVNVRNFIEAQKEPEVNVEVHADAPACRCPAG